MNSQSVEKALIFTRENHTAADILPKETIAEIVLVFLTKLKGEANWWQRVVLGLVIRLIEEFLNEQDQ